MQDVEDEFVTACRKQGFQPSADAMRQAAIDLAGSALTAGLIVMPGKGSITPKDFASSLRNQMPEAFEALNHVRSSGNLTTDMRREIAARSRSLPADWSDIRSRMTGLTAQMMDERAATHRKGK
jgi:hypothetical protein